MANNNPINEEPVTFDIVGDKGDSALSTWWSKNKYGAIFLTVCFYCLYFSFIGRLCMLNVEQKMFLAEQSTSIRQSVQNDEKNYLREWTTSLDIVPSNLTKFNFEDYVGSSNGVSYPMLNAIDRKIFEQFVSIAMTHDYVPRAMQNTPFELLWQLKATKYADVANTLNELRNKSKTLNDWESQKQSIINQKIGQLPFVDYVTWVVILTSLIPFISFFIAMPIIWVTVKDNNDHKHQ
jgi:hypothetical protein